MAKKEPLYPHIPKSRISGPLEIVKAGNTPIVGLVATDGYIEGYSLEIAKEADFHHTFALSLKGNDYYENDDNTLRWAWNDVETKWDTHTFTLEGNTIHDPYGAGRAQIQQFARYVLSEAPIPI